MNPTAPTEAFEDIYTAKTVINRPAKSSGVKTAPKEPAKKAVVNSAGTSKAVSKSQSKDRFATLVRVGISLGILGNLLCGLAAILWGASTIYAFQHIAEYMFTGTPGFLTVISLMCLLTWVVVLPLTLIGTGASIAKSLRERSFSFMTGTGIAINSVAMVNTLGFLVIYLYMSAG